MLTRLRSRRDAGDTIVEVLVVLAVLGLALGISYATASRSLRSTTGAQENSRATALLQAQIEALRYLAPTPAPASGQDIFGQSGLFCIDTQALTVDSTFGGSLNTDLIHNPGDIYPAICEQDAPFHIAISKADSGTGAVFTLKATWDDIHGNGLDTVTLSYRLYHD